MSMDMVRDDEGSGGHGHEEGALARKRLPRGEVRSALAPVPSPAAEAVPTETAADMKQPKPRFKMTITLEVTEPLDQAALLRRILGAY
jgi:hypothetical protein